MKKYLAVFNLMCFSAVVIPQAHAALNVLACEPEWGALTQALAGDRVHVYVATTAQQDPHHIQARPSLIARARGADLLVCTGADLEAGWLPVLLRQAGNARIQPGQPGNVVAADAVKKLEIPASVDRAQGDVHAAGNPHIQTDPRNIAAVARVLAARLAQIDPAHAADYAAQHVAFAQRWQAAIQRWETAAAPLQGVAIVTQHKGFPYLNQWLGLKEITTLEPQPGVDPSAAYLGEVLARLQRTPAKMILRAAYNDGRPAQWLAERAHLPVVVVPFTVGGNEQAQDLFSLFDDTVARLLGALR
ncbi:MAG: zinc ABC transporter substrate-binding protein [Gammaproteobacteria bacterium]|nr:zinc ABC transporter substrate-binding protein [Gammaproteobacteria bacterium]